MRSKNRWQVPQPNRSIERPALSLFLVVISMIVARPVAGQPTIEWSPPMEPSKVFAVLGPSTSELALAPRCEAPGRLENDLPDGLFVSEVTCGLEDWAEDEPAGLTVTEVRDIGRFQRGLLERAAEVSGLAVGALSTLTACPVQRLSCGQTVTLDSACRFDGGSVALWELQGFAGATMRLEATGGGDLVLVDPDRATAASVSVRGSRDVGLIEQVLDQTGHWGVALVLGSDADLRDQRLRVSCDGLAGTVADGAYTGTHTLGGDMEIVVTNGRVQSLKIKSISCPGFTLTEAAVSFTGGCTIAGDGSFNCGITGCSPFATQMRASGQFNGNNATGQIVLNSQPSATTSCCQRTMNFSATRGTTGPTVPQAPSNLTAAALSQTSVRLDWKDNSNNEDQFRIEGQMGSDAFSDIGSVGANVESTVISNLTPSAGYGFRVRARNAGGNSDYSNTANVTTLAAPQNCNPSTNVHCLRGNRFKVDVAWRNQQGAAGRGVAVPETDSAGLFWFFSADNIEMLLKILDGCSINNRFWVFAAATTDVEYTLTVTDTDTSVPRTYFNPLGNPASPIQDTSAFATCP